MIDWKRGIILFIFFGCLYHKKKVKNKSVHLFQKKLIFFPQMFIIREWDRHESIKMFVNRRRNTIWVICIFSTLANVWNRYNHNILSKNHLHVDCMSNFCSSQSTKKKHNIVFFKIKIIFSIHQHVEHRNRHVFFIFLFFFIRKNSGLKFWFYFVNNIIEWFFKKILLACIRKPVIYYMKTLSFKREIVLFVFPSVKCVLNKSLKAKREKKGLFASNVPFELKLCLWMQ